MKSNNLGRSIADQNYLNWIICNFPAYLFLSFDTITIPQNDEKIKTVSMLEKMIE